MGELTEREIFDCLTTNFRLAAEHCEKLAVSPRKGPTYRKLRDCLALLEGACRQAAYWRQDARWLRIGLMMEEAHKRAGDWLRGIKTPSGVRVKLAAGQIHPLFNALAENLRAAQVKSEQFRDAATGRVGTILPKPLPGPHRDTRPTGWRATQSGILIPATEQRLAS